MIRRVMLDTDILSAIMRRNPAVISKTRDYLSIHRQLTFSMISRYEILRGLCAKERAAVRKSLLTHNPCRY